MNGYRCDSGGDPGKYTITMVNAGVKTIMPVSAAGAFASNIYINNYNIIIGKKVNNCVGMFRFSSFNKLIDIPDGADCSNMFLNCNYLNQNIVPSNNSNCSSMFKYCINLNQNIRIPNNSDLTFMFSGCGKLNCPMVIPGDAVTCGFMFFNCTNYNSNITISEGVTNCYGMLNGCVNFDPGDVIIPSTVNDVRHMFVGCNSFSHNVYITATNSNVNVNRMFYQTSNTYRKNVFYNSNIGNLATAGICGSSSDSYTEITNGYYYPNNNLYLYYNYAP